MEALQLPYFLHNSAVLYSIGSIQLLAVVYLAVDQPKDGPVVGSRGAIKGDLAIANEGGSDASVLVGL